MFVKSLQLENVRTFKNLDFSFERPDGSFAGWTVFVGGNASGKSTLLRSIALTLMGPEAGLQLAGRGAGWIRSGQTKAEAILSLVADPTFDRFRQAGKTTTEFKAGVRWIVDSIGETPQFRDLPFYTPTRTKVKTAERGLWDPNAKGWFSVGYGPMRRLSGSSSESIRYAVGGGVVSRHVTLFREDAALSESEDWLKKMHARTLEKERTDIEQLKKLVDGVTKLLSDGLLPHRMHISRLTVDNVFVEDDQGIELPMREISDGCRGVYATILDLVHGMYEVYGADGLFETVADGTVTVPVPGVVLIDEIEAHLHPSWQRDIPEWLKQHFPNVQFLVTTHSPLIAQAADPNGLFVLPLQNDTHREARALSGAEYERVRLGNAHKTVLGIAFGLHTTRTKWANQRIHQWQKLEAKQQAGVALSLQEKREFKKLAKQMDLAFDSDSELNGVD